MRNKGGASKMPVDGYEHGTMAMEVFLFNFAVVFNVVLFSFKYMLIFLVTMIPYIVYDSLLTTSQQCCGSGSAFIWLSWIRMRNGNAYPDSGTWKLTKIYK
jgi:hypothetical protein